MILDKLCLHNYGHHFDIPTQVSISLTIIHDTFLIKYTAFLAQLSIK